MKGYSIDGAFMTRQQANTFLVSNKENADEIRKQMKPAIRRKNGVVELV